MKKIKEYIVPLLIIMTGFLLAYSYFFKSYTLRELDEMHGTNFESQAKVNEWLKNNNFK